MRKIVILLLIFVAISFCGCFGGKPFQPNPPEYMMWEERGKSEADIKKSLLECGFSTVYHTNLTKIHMTYNEFLLSYRCMKNQGYIYKSSDLCSGYEHYKNHKPACKMRLFHIPMWNSV
jgi:hypothetical protein